MDSPGNAPAAEDRGVADVLSSTALGRCIREYLSELHMSRASEHTVRNYGSDLRQFAHYLIAKGHVLDPAAIDLLTLRSWLADLYGRKPRPAAVTVRRKLAAIRSFFQFLLARGVIPVNQARLLRTPKAPFQLPYVPDQGYVVQLIEQAAAAPERPFPERDAAILEVLYGCGLRVSELVGLNLSDLGPDNLWLRVRGKGKKERQVPCTRPAAAALNKYLAVRRPTQPNETAVFLNCRGARLSARAVRNLVHDYHVRFGDGTKLSPHTFRHAYATHLLAGGADLRSVQELLGHSKLSTTQKYTQVDLTDLMRIYDKSHPKA